MSTKITWKDVRDDFKRYHPKLHKSVAYWAPHSYATIVLYLKDGRKLTFNYDTKEITYLKGGDAM